MVVDVDDFRGFQRMKQVSEDAIQGLKRELLRRVSGVMRGAFPRALLHPRSDEVLALLPLGPDGTDYQARVNGVALQVREVVAVGDGGGLGWLRAVTRGSGIKDP